MSGVATQPPPPGPQEPPVANGGPPPGPDPAPETNGADHKAPGAPANGGRGPPSAATAAQCQKMLDENSSLISTISEYQKMGRHNETMSYQWQLHQNLMKLAQMADSMQNLQQLLPPPGHVSYHR